MLIAQDVTGDWQEIIESGDGLRAVVHIVRTNNGALKATFYSIDESPDGVPISSTSFKDSVLRFSIDSPQQSFKGEMRGEGGEIKGELHYPDDVVPIPLRLYRVTKGKVWKIDPCPHTIRFLKVEKNVNLEVAGNFNVFAGAYGISQDRGILPALRLLVAMQTGISIDKIHPETRQMRSCIVANPSPSPFCPNIGSLTGTR